MLKLRNLLFFGIWALAAPALAQGVDPVRYIVAPETPGPGEQVTIQVEGVGGFLGESQITWRQDGKVVLEGAGERQYSFMVGALGERTTVAVEIRSESYGTLRRTFVIAPSVVTMLWEADTTIPPLYRGKPLYSAGSTLKVFAFPTVYSGASLISSRSLTYQWSRGDEVVGEASGLGRSTITISGDQLKNVEEVSVDVYLGTTKVGRGEVVVPAVEPRVVLYQYDALRGVQYDQALPPGVSLTAPELTLKAEGYYFARESRQQNVLTHSWQLNGEEVTGPDSPRGILTLRQAGAGAGSAILTTSLQNFDSSKFVQAAEVSLQLIFGNSTNPVGSFFGL